MGCSEEFLLSLYEIMQKIRKFEQAAEQLLLEGKLPGFMHLYIGEEAIAAGIMAALNMVRILQNRVEFLGLIAHFLGKYPDRIFDTPISEEVI